MPTGQRVCWRRRARDVWGFPRPRHRAYDSGMSFILTALSIGVPAFAVCIVAFSLGNRNAVRGVAGIILVVFPILIGPLRVQYYRERGLSYEDIPKAMVTDSIQLPIGILQIGGAVMAFVAIYREGRRRLTRVTTPPPTPDSPSESN
jgi:hypothetical protein